MVFFGTFGYRKLAEYGRNILKQWFFETSAFPGYFFVTDGRRDLGMNSNERSWREYVPFQVLTRFGYRNLTKMSQNTDFSTYKLVRARTFERKIIDTWL